MAVIINGSNTPTAGGVTYGDGSAYATTAAGTSGQVLTSAGSSTPTWSTPAGGFSTIQLFTSSGTFTIPSGKTTVKVTVIGGGGQGGTGSGGGRDSLGFGGGGGGAGISYLRSLTPGNTISVTVGAGGSGGSGGGW